MTASSDLDRAKAEAIAAREQLAATMSEIQDRLNPRVLLREAWDELRERGDQAAGEAIDLIKSRPAATAGIAAAVGLVLLRHPLGRAAAQLFFNGGETETADGKLNAVKAPRPPRRTPRNSASEKGD